MIAHEGGLRPYFIPGIIRLPDGSSRERKLRKMHQPDTNANCRTVNVTGWGNALRIDFEDVFDSPETVYLRGT